MIHRTDDLRIEDIRPLLPPAILMEEIPLGEKGSEVVAGSLPPPQAIHRRVHDLPILEARPISLAQRE